MIGLHHKIFFTIALSLVSTHGVSLLSTGLPHGENLRPSLGGSRGMGGVGAALAGPSNLSLINPANLCAVPKTAFSVLYQQEKLTLADDVGKSGSTGGSGIPLAVFVTAIPKLGNLHAAYRQNSKTEYQFAPGVRAIPGRMDSIKQSLVGRGSRFAGQVGISRKLASWLEAGIALEYGLGLSKSVKTVKYDSPTGTIYADHTDTTSLNSESKTLGVGLAIPGGNLRLGFAYAHPLGSSVSQTTTFAIHPHTGALVFRDEKVELSETLAPSIVAGFAMRLGTQWQFGADGETVLWERYARDGFTGALENSIRVGIGGEWVGNRYSEFSWKDRIPLRAGAFYQKWPVPGVKETGFSLGAGLPLGKKSGILDVSLEYALRGDAQTVLLMEKDLQLSVVFTANAEWGKPRGQ